MGNFKSYATSLNPPPPSSPSNKKAMTVTSLDFMQNIKRFIRLYRWPSLFQLALFLYRLSYSICLYSAHSLSTSLFTYKPLLPTQTLSYFFLYLKHSQ